MKLIGDYSGDKQYSAGDVVRWTDGTASEALEDMIGIPPTDTKRWARLPQYMWNVVTLILDSINITQAVIDSRITEDTIVLKGQGGTTDYLLTVDDSGDTPELDIDAITAEGEGD